MQRLRLDLENQPDCGPMQAIGACMRKLVMICFGVLKNRATFDPNWSSTITT